ncbi:hypothetical protein ACFLTR_01535 [Chloroflexota bacterium]
MEKLLRVTWLVFMATIVLSAGCSSQPNPSASPKPLPWEEAYGRFYTLDLARAQEQIPFSIVLPTHVPDKRRDVPPPAIDGPLREYQYEGKVKIHIFYRVDLGNGVRGIIEIIESNYPVLPGDPKLNPHLKVMEIRGKTVIKTEGNFSLGSGVIFFFSRNNIYLEVGLYNFPYEESVKIVESILE